MCDFNPRNDSRFVDPCMRDLIAFLNAFGVRTVACCCGHGIYPMTIVVRTEDGMQEICHNVMIPRQRRFYRKDKEGVYYIPEVVK